MGRYASLLGLFGLILLAFGLFARLLGLGGDQAFGPDDLLVWLHLGVGTLLLVGYLTFGLENLRVLVGQRSTRYGASAAVYSLLFVALIAGANYLGHRHHKRWDVTEGGVYTMSPQTLKVVQSLQEPVTMTAFVEGGVNPTLESLLEGYTYGNPGKVKTRMVDPDKEPTLVDQMKITTAPSVNLQYGNELRRHRPRDDHERSHPRLAQHEEDRYFVEGSARRSPSRIRRATRAARSNGRTTRSSRCCFRRSRSPTTRAS